MVNNKNQTTEGKGIKEKVSAWENPQWLKGLGLSGSQVKYIKENIECLLERKETQTIQRIRNFNFGELGVEMERYINETSKEAVKKVKEKYSELIMAVGNKYEGETRHETALRYIKEAERGSGEAKQFFNHPTHH